MANNNNLAAIAFANNKVRRRHSFWRRMRMCKFFDFSALYERLPCFPQVSV